MDFFLAISNPFFTTWLAALAVLAAVEPMALPTALFPEVIARLECPVANILPAPEPSDARRPPNLLADAAAPPPSAAAIEGIENITPRTKAAMPIALSEAIRISAVPIVAMC